MSLLDAFLEEGLTKPLPYSGLNNSRREVFIAIRTDGAIGAGTPDNPYNGSTDGLLDALLRNADLITGNMTIRFGPGIFETKGGGVGTAEPQWNVQTGQRFIGSGMHQTTLRLVKARPQPGTAAKVAVFFQFVAVSDVEISDLTVDCNLSRQPKAANGEPALINCPAIDLENAANTLIRRVRVINWGTHTPLRVNGVEQSSWECFPIGINPPYRPAYGGNNVVEDCIIEQPDLHPARESTLINAKAIPMATIRNCYLNCDFTTGSPQPALQVLRIECADNVVTLQTRWPHNMQQGDSLWLAGSPAASFNDRNGRPARCRRQLAGIWAASPTACSPEGRKTIAQRFNAGSGARPFRVPPATTGAVHDGGMFCRPWRDWEESPPLVPCVETLGYSPVSLRDEISGRQRQTHTLAEENPGVLVRPSRQPDGLFHPN